MLTELAYTVATLLAYCLAAQWVKSVYERALIRFPKPKAKKLAKRRKNP